MWPKYVAANGSSNATVRYLAHAGEEVRPGRFAIGHEPLEGGPQAASKALAVGPALHGRWRLFPR